MTYLENNIKATQTTEVSEELTIENCAGVKGKLDIKSGKTEQATSTDNLFDNTWEQGLIDGATGNNEENTEFIRTGYIKIFPNCLYEISRSIYTSYMVFRFYDKNKKYLGNQTTEGIMTYSTSSGRMDVNEKSMTFTIINTNVAYMRISDATNDLSTIYTMITNCPSPDYPSRIRNVGDNINLFDKSLISKNYIYNNGLKLDRDNLRTTAILLPKKIKAGKYTISFKYGNNSTSKNFGIQFINSNVTVESIVFTTQNKETFTISKEVDRLYFYINNSEASGIVLYLDDIKLEEGSIATPYTPYNCGSADFKITGKNKLKITSFVNRTTDGVTFTAKFDKKGNLEYINAVGNSTTGYRDIMRVDISNLLAGKYKINGLGTDKVIRYVLLKANDTEAKAITTNTDVEFTQDSSSPYVTFRIDLYQAGEIDCQIKPMIRPSIITDNTYEPYQEQIVSFPFTEGQVLHKGDYLASDGIHQKRKTLVLDGTENWVVNTSYENTFYCNKPANLLKNSIRYSNITTNFEKLLSTVSDGIVIGGYLNVKNSNISTLEEFINEVKNNNIIIEYELAEEIVIPYTPEQEESHYELQHLLMYEGYTSIECIDEIKPDIQGTYYFNNELNNMYISRIDSLEEKIRLLEKAVSSQSGVSE